MIDAVIHYQCNGRGNILCIMSDRAGTSPLNKQTTARMYLTHTHLLTQASISPSPSLKYVQGEQLKSNTD